MRSGVGGGDGGLYGAVGDKRGILEVVSWDIQGEGLDEIVISGVAMMEFMRRQRGD